VRQSGTVARKPAIPSPDRTSPGSSTYSCNGGIMPHQGSGEAIHGDLGLFETEGFAGGVVELTGHSKLALGLVVTQRFHGAWTQLPIGRPWIESRSL
jgi:hypothetical protein